MKNNLDVGQMVHRFYLCLCVCVLFILISLYYLSRGGGCLAEASLTVRLFCLENDKICVLSVLIHFGHIKWTKHSALRYYLHHVSTQIIFWSKS